MSYMYTSTTLKYEKQGERGCNTTFADSLEKLPNSDSLLGNHGDVTLHNFKNSKILKATCSGNSFAVGVLISSRPA